METRYKIFKWCFSFLLVIFLTLYFSQLTGYYEYQNYQKMVMTEEQIKQFEQDIKEGKEVDIKDYVVNIKKEYDNSFSNLGVTISNIISSTVKNTIIKLFSGIANMVEDNWLVYFTVLYLFWLKVF